MPGRLVARSLTSALTGFIVGVDTVVVSGVEQTIEAVVQIHDGRFWMIGVTESGGSLAIMSIGAILSVRFYGICNAGDRKVKNLWA
jgi:hypothetical protein